MAFVKKWLFPNHWSFKASALKESSFRTDKLFLIKFLIFVCITLEFVKYWATFVFGVPLDSFTGWRLTQYQVEDQGFLVFQVSQTWKNSIFSRINHFDLKSFLFFRATHALRFYALFVVGELLVNFLCFFEAVLL